MFIQGFYFGKKDQILFYFDGLLMLGDAFTFKNTGIVSYLIQRFSSCRRMPHSCDQRTDKKRQEARDHPAGTINPERFLYGPGSFLGGTKLGNRANESE
jgi:hypothetical protein